MIEQAAAQGWEIHRLECGGCVAAVRGAEIHVEFTRPGVISRRTVRELLGPLLAREGFLTTRVALDDERNRRFVERMRFVPTWSDENYRYYILTALPFCKEQ